MFSMKAVLVGLDYRDVGSLKSKSFRRILRLVRMQFFHFFCRDSHTDCYCAFPNKLMP